MSQPIKTKGPEHADALGKLATGVGAAQTAIADWRKFNEQNPGWMDRGFASLPNTDLKKRAMQIHAALTRTMPVLLTGGTARSLTEDERKDLNHLIGAEPNDLFSNGENNLQYLDHIINTSYRQGIAEHSALY